MHDVSCIVTFNMIKKKKKFMNPTRMKDFWPIFLYNILYKIISKALANRLKSILPKCISQEQ